MRLVRMVLLGAVVLSSAQDIRAAPAPLPAQPLPPLTDRDVCGTYTILYPESLGDRVTFCPDHWCMAWNDTYTYLGRWRLDGDVVSVVEWIITPVEKDVENGDQVKVKVSWYITLRRGRKGEVLQVVYPVTFGGPGEK